MEGAGGRAAAEPHAREPRRPEAEQEERWQDGVVVLLQGRASDVSPFGQDHRNLIGRKVLIAHERTKTLEPGWYMGRIKLFGVSASWQKVCTSANFLVRYAKKETDNALDGDSAIELATHNYGRDEWWLLLDAAPAAAVSGQ